MGSSRQKVMSRKKIGQLKIWEIESKNSNVDSDSRVRSFFLYPAALVTSLIINITLSSNVIDLKDLVFSTNLLPIK